MRAKKPVRLLVIGAGLVFVLVALFYPTDEKRVKAAAEAIIDAANTGEIELGRALDEHAVPEVSIDVAELSEPVTGRDALVGLVGTATREGQKPSLRLEAVEVSLEGKRARVNADLLTTLRPELPELRRPRHAVALFEKRAGTYRLLSAEVGAERRDQPEARP